MRKIKNNQESAEVNVTIGKNDYLSIEWGKYKNILEKNTTHRYLKRQLVSDAPVAQCCHAFDS